LQTKLNEVKAELQRRMHEPIPELGKWLQAVVRGHNRYYGVPMNRPALVALSIPIGWLWQRALSRRSQNGHVLVGSYAALDQPLAADACDLSSLSLTPHGAIT